MRYQLVCIGAAKRKFIVAGCQFYEARLRPFARLDIVALKESKAKTKAQVQLEESSNLLSAANGYIISLDEGGKQFGSIELASYISELENRSISQVSLLIGGAEGHSDALKRSAAASLSLSNLTLPHDLARLVLLEQLYRAETIRAGHPYHRE